MLKKLFNYSIKTDAIIFLLFAFSSYGAFSQTKTLGLTKHFSGGDEDGYVLFSPLGSDTTYLINKCGKRIHSWYSEYTPGLSVYLLPNGHLLKTGTYTDSVFGFAGGRGGIIEEYDWDGKIVWRYKLFNDSLCQHHDITPLPNGNVLVLSWHSISKMEAMALGRKSVNFGLFQSDLWGERILELKPKGKDSAEIVWQWDLFDHIVQDDDSIKPNYGVISSKPELVNINYALNLTTNDWIHANGLDYNEKLDQIVISCHNFSEIWIIDHSTTKAQSNSHKGGKSGKGGDLLYRWGNPIAYNFGSTQDRKLFRQHNAQWIKDGLQDSGSILVFNNGWDRDTAYSSVEVIKPPLLSNGNYVNMMPYGPLNPSWIYKDPVPTKFYSNIISGAQRLPNGNTLICSGVQGMFFEVTPQKNIVWEYRNPTNGYDIQTDGDKPANNMVFRCVYYPNTYSAFKNKILVPASTIELKSYVYSCVYETTPPKLTALSPAKNEKVVDPSSDLKITFDEGVLANMGAFTIFQNNSFLETVNIPGNQVLINGNSVTILHNKIFSLNSRISIILSKNSFRDSSNNFFAGIDSSAWYFTTAETKPVAVSFFPEPNSENISTDTKIQINFNQKIKKSTTGDFVIWENGILKEKIPINSSRIAITDNLVTLIPTSPFGLNSEVIIEYGRCFLDSNGIGNDANIYGDWQFKTLTPPVITMLSPANKSTGAPVNTTLSIGFDRKIGYGANGFLMIYENNILIDSIQINGPRAMINNDIIDFDLNANFKYASRISIGLHADILKDTFGTFFSGIDTSEWHFNIIPSTTAIVSNFKENDCIIYPNPSKGKIYLTSSIKIESITVFNTIGQKVESVIINLSDYNADIQLKTQVTGNYILLINGLYKYGIAID